MIIADDASTSPLKTPTGSHAPSTSRDDASEIIPPPSYYGSMSDPTISSGSSVPRSPYYQHSRPPPSEQLPSYYVPLQQPSKPPNDRGWSAVKRFARAFLAALIAMLLFSILMDSLATIWRFRSSRNDPWSQLPLPDIDLDGCNAVRWKKVSGYTYDASASLFTDAHASLNISPEERDDLLAMSSRGKDNFPLAARAYLDMPLTDDTFMLIAQGARQSGSLHVTTHSKRGDDQAHATVTVKYLSSSALARTHICPLSSRGIQGLGIRTPTSRASEDLSAQIFVIIELSLPASHASKIDGFQTHLPHYSQYITDMGDVRFSHMYLNGTSSPIHAANVVTDTLVIDTSNAPITGIFNTTSMIQLTTSNAPIDVELGLAHGKESTPTVAFLRSSNAYVSAKSHLLSDSKAPRYTISAETSNKDIDLTFPTSPLDAAVVTHAKTSNGAARVAVHRAFEGDFVLSTSNAPAVVDESGAEDPTGKGRRRTVWVDSQGADVLVASQVRGAVSWGERRRTYGSSVDITSSNGRVTLIV